MFFACETTFSACLPEFESPPLPLLSLFLSLTQGSPVVVLTGTAEIRRLSGPVARYGGNESLVGRWASGLCFEE